MKKLFLFSFLIFNFSFLIVSCHCKKKTTSVVSNKPASEMTAEELQKTQDQQHEFANEGYLRGKVFYNEVENCGYMIQLGNGTKLQPTKKLSAEFQKNGLDVWVKYTSKKGAVSTCMSGEVVDITDIQLRR